MSEKVIESISDSSDDKSEDESESTQGSDSLKEAEKEKAWKWQNYVEIGGKIKCKACDMKYSMKTSHSTLKKHFKNFHQAIKSKVLTKWLEKPQEKKFNFNEALIEFIITGSHSFRIVEEPNFIKLIKGINSSINIPARTTIRKWLNEKFEENKQKLIRHFEDHDGKVSLTFDFWTSITSKPYIVVTSHIIEHGNLKHIIIEFNEIPYPHDGQQIMESLINTIREFKLVGKVISITSDNESANVKAMRMLNEYPNYKDISHIRCIAHVLNLVVKSGLKILSQELNSVRSLVNYINTSSKRRQLYEEACHQLKIPHYILIKEMPVRWNSTYLMLERAIKMQKVLNYFCHQEESCKEYLISDWQALEDICRFLSPFNEATLMLSGQTYSSICQVVVIIDALQLHLESKKFEDHSIIKKCVPKMKEKLNEYA